MLIRTLLFKILTTYDGKGFEDADKAAEGVKKSADKATDEVKKLGTALDGEAKAAKKSAKETDKAGKEIKQVGTEAKKSGKAAGVMEKLMGGAAAGIAASFASAGIAAIVAGIATAISFVSDETARLDKIAKGAQISGLGVEAYQRLGQVATLAGTDVDKLAKGTIRLERNLQKVADGRGAEVADMLARLNLSVESFEGKSQTEKLAILSDAMRDIEDPAEKTAIAMELMGKSGADLVPLLNSGSEAINALSDDVRHVFTGEELARAEAYQDSLANLNKEIADIKGAIALGAAPVFQRFSEFMRDIIPVIQAWAKDVAKPFERLIKAVRPLVEEFGPGLTDWLENAVGPLRAAVELLGWFADKLALIIEVGTVLVGWIQDLLGLLETRWPGAWEKAASVIDVFLSPLETARNVISDILDFIAEAASELEGVSDTVNDIKGAIGLGDGGGGQLTSTASATQAFRAAQQSQTSGTERQRNQEDRRADRAAAREQGAASFARGEAGALGRTARRRGRRGGGGGGAAPTEAEPTGFLADLGLTAPGTVMAARPLPQTLTFIFSTVFNVGTGMTIHIEHTGSPEQDRALQDAGNQARDTMMAKISDIAPALDLLLATKAKALRARAGGGQTPRGSG